MKVAAILDIPFITLDLEKEYKKEVVDYMIAEYKIGRTPNPDVMCNKEIKFGHFLKFALKNGADFVATGHYAELSKNKLGSEVLSEAKDKNKDQSYFLWTLTQAELKHTLFPIGHLQKSEVRKLAGKFGLPQETRKDSQGLCFLGKIDMKEFLTKYIGTKKGKVLNENGEPVGEHDGAILYTIGERHGFTINQKSENKSPLYVVKKDIEKNTITVAPKHFGRPSQMLVKNVILKDLNLNDPTSLPPSHKASVGQRKLRGTKGNLSCRIRYRQEKIDCKVEISKKETKVIFDKPQMGVSPGQSLVLYSGEICLGGGIIE